MNKISQQVEKKPYELYGDDGIYMDLPIYDKCNNEGKLNITEQNVTAIVKEIKQDIINVLNNVVMYKPIQVDNWKDAPISGCYHVIDKQNDHFFIKNGILHRSFDKPAAIINENVYVFYFNGVYKYIEIKTHIEPYINDNNDVIGSLAVNTLRDEDKKRLKDKLNLNF